jgi:Mrp family chromosome partitioning ATPase
MIPRFEPREARRSVWQRPIVSLDGLDVSSHLGPLLANVTGAPGDRGKVVVISSVEAGAGASTIARCLNSAALDEGMISVLIEVQPDAAGLRADRPGRSGHHASQASLRSINQLLATASNAGRRPLDDIRSDFDLIVIDAPPLRRQSEIASLLARADVVILVAQDLALERHAIEDARDLLLECGSAALGVVVNRARMSRRPEDHDALSGVA